MILKFITKFFAGVLVLLLVGVASLFLIPILPIENNIEIKIVKSGSMEPYMKTGGIIIIKPSGVYKVGDVITFGKDIPDSHPTTHRIESVREFNGEILFTTKGDANEEIDPKEVNLSEVMGKVLFTAPFAGYVLDFARQPIGFALLIAFPSAILILLELVNIFKEFKKLLLRRKGIFYEDDDSAKSTSQKKSAEKVLRRLYKMDDILRPVYSVNVEHVNPTRNKKMKLKTSFTAGITALFATSFIFTNFGDTVSYFSDSENSADNTTRAISFEINAFSSPESSYVGLIGNSIIDSSVTPNPEGLPHEYRVYVEKVDGSDVFCKALYVNSNGVPPFEYSGSLLDFESPPTTFSGEWQFEVSVDPLAEGINEDDVCVVNLIYSGATWIEDKLVHGGYSDVKKVPLTFEAGEHDYGGEVLETFTTFSSEQIESAPENITEVEKDVIEYTPQEENNLVEETYIETQLVEEELPPEENSSQSEDDEESPSI